MNIDQNLLAVPGDLFSLEQHNTSYTGDIPDKKAAKKILKQDIKKLASLQDKLYAHDKYAVLIIFQAMDAAGKDGTIKHVMSGINPQGCQVFSFKQPSSEELEHDFLWRTVKALPERGRIGIFNRSYYEEVLITKVHPGFILKQHLPGITKPEDVTEEFWNGRYRRINNFEEHLSASGTVIIKFFLNVSKEEQKNRFLKRIEKEEKNWKFTMNDISERQHWDKYQQAFADMIRHTSTRHSPWYVIPADNKWYMRTAVAQIVIAHLEQLQLHYPVLSKDQKSKLTEAKKILMNE